MPVPLQGRDQMPEFRVGFGRVGEGVGNFLAQNFAVTLAQTVNGDFDGHDGHVQFGGDARVGQSVGVIQQAGAEAVEQFGLAAQFEFLAQPPPGAVEQGQGETAVELAVGGAFVRRFECQSRLGVLGVERNQFHRATALERGGIAVRVMKMMIERGEQKCAKAAAAGIGVLEQAAFEQVREETLGQIARGFGGVTPAADMRVERKPVGLAKGGQSLAGAGRGGMARSQHEAPAGGAQFRMARLVDHAGAT